MCLQVFFVQQRHRTVVTIADMTAPIKKPVMNLIQNQTFGEEDCELIKKGGNITEKGGLCMVL